MSTARQILRVSVVSLCVISALNIFKIFLSPTYIDFTWNYSDLQAFTHNANPYELTHFPFSYPPPALLLFLPFSFFPLQLAGHLFLILSFISILVSILLLFKLFNISIKSLSFLVSIILVCNFFPVKFSLSMGQINSLVLVLLALFIFWYRSRPTAAGAVLALAIAIKLYPLFILPYLLIDKQRRMVTSFISTMILIATMTYLMLPPAVIKSFFSKTLPSLMNTGRGTNYYDQSLYAFVARALPDIDTLDISRTVVIMLLILTYAFLWFHREKVRNNYLGISLILIINLLFSNFTWQHHFIWLLLPLFITYRYIHRTNPYRRYYIIYAVSYALLAFNFKNPSGLHFLLLSNQFYGALLLYCLIIFMILSSPSAPVVAKKYKHNKITQHTP